MKQLTLALVATVTFAAAASAGSILPQIRTARSLTALGLSEEPVLRKHYVEVAPGVYQAVKGERERRQIRFARWKAMLDGDRARIYETHGHPVFRHQELTAGILREFWTYPEQRWTYVFEGGRLVDTRRF